MVSGHQLHRAKIFFIAEDGQGEDRLIMFAMSKLNIALSLLDAIMSNKYMMTKFMYSSLRAD